MPDQPSYPSRGGVKDLRERLWENEQADAAQDARIDALEASSGEEITDLLAAYTLAKA